MDWPELLAHLRQRRQVVSDEGERLTLLLRYAGTENEDPIGQRIEVAPATVVGAPWVAFWADLCPISEIAPRRALVHNGTLAVGSITINEDYYFLRHAVPLEGLATAHLDLLIDLLAHEAARLRARRSITPSPEVSQATGKSVGNYAE